MSISLRLTFWFSAVFLCVFIAFGTFLYLDLSWSLTNKRDKSLSRRAEKLVDLISRAQSKPSADLQTSYYKFVEDSPENKLIQLYSLNGLAILQPSGLNASEFPWPHVPSSKTEYRCDTWFDGRPFRVFVRAATLHGAPVRVFAAAQLSDNDHLLDRLTEILERSIPVMLLISALAGYLISRRALRPVVRLTESARSITIGNLAARLPVSPSGDELAQLAETCNAMLSRLDEAVNRITQFTADASHELRSPMALIRATCEYALSTPGLDAETTRAFESIVNEAEHSSRLLEDMLLLARSDAGRVELAFEPVFLAEIIGSVVARMSILAKMKEQSLVQRIPDVDLQVTGDASMLRRLIQILLDNAIKYTPTDGRIEVALVGKGRYALLTVSDNGVGIPEAALPYVFDRFFRVDASRGEHEGTGLGLAIGKWIAESHRASIAARSLNRAGTTFEVAFPLN
jgi:heavy metal sensor kinase